MDKQKMMAMAERVYRDVAGAIATGLGYLGARAGCSRRWAAAAR